EHRPAPPEGVVAYHRDGMNTGIFYPPSDGLIRIVPQRRLMIPIIATTRAMGYLGACKDSANNLVICSR
ncbi:MAG: hypothetical protein KAX78_04760, partial [Phycisphaerae bacterium]|nr:hypothetical protein [Phycisphaerae bacterium]